MCPPVPCICIDGGRVLISVLIMLGYISPRVIYIMMSPTLSRSQYNVSPGRTSNPNIVILIAVEIFMCKMCNKSRFIGTKLRWNCRMNCWPFIFFSLWLLTNAIQDPLSQSHIQTQTMMTGKRREGGVRKRPNCYLNVKIEELWIFQNNLPRNSVSYFEAWSYRNYN